MTLVDVNSPVKLNNGVEIPCVGYGTFRTEPAATAAAVKAALQVGYRHIDTASLYKNEAGVGQAIKESGLAREDLFVTSKLWTSDWGYENVKQAFQASLDRLGLDYLDLYLIHWPAPMKNSSGLMQLRLMQKHGGLLRSYIKKEKYGPLA